MSLNEHEIQQHAARIIAEHNTEYEFCLVYEDEDLEDATESDWRAIHDAMYGAQIRVEWPTETTPPADLAAATETKGA